MSKYTPTIGLEVHAELKTQSKMFCDCKNDPDVHDEQRRGGTEASRPNVNVCPVCLGHPGTLPVPNKGAIRHILKIGLAVGGTLAEKSKFDRKNYFYPDLPKGYQISQYDMPFVKGGELLGVKITRVHLEEDAGSLLHESRIKNQESSSSLVDFNRAGVPLMELVTEPVMHDAETAVRFAKELQLLLRYLGASDADMEKGLMRLEANVSVAPDPGVKDTPTPGSSVALGTKVEVKNLNSFKVLHDAIEYEIKRQSEALENGEKIKQETRGWDEVKKMTVSQRSKEEAHDYRYFPEPDISPLDIPKLFDLEVLRVEIPELPWDKRRRFAAEYKLTDEKATLLTQDQVYADYFEKCASEFLALLLENQKAENPSYELLYNYLTSDLRGLMSEWAYALTDLKFEPEDFAHLVFLAYTEKIGSRAAKDILRKMIETGADPENIIREEGLEQVSDEAALLEVVKKVIEENQDVVASYKKGKENAIQALVGKAMGKLKGAGNPKTLLELLRKELG